MSLSRISPGCKRVTVDIPMPLFLALKAHADAEPKLPVSEWIRRMIAFGLKVNLPTMKQRKEAHIRRTGERKRSRHDG